MNRFWESKGRSCLKLLCSCHLLETWKQVVSRVLLTSVYSLVFISLTLVRAGLVLDSSVLASFLFVPSGTLQKELHELYTFLDGFRVCTCWMGSNSTLDWCMHYLGQEASMKGPSARVRT
ncbi:uncharacterized protein BO72DRAFT_210441 [Aspergillus fijiensis CBS 313.89]|uniref:Uncharacterized protein n=1 Tax=Aspergillus fijiensis CBS 313.89 TaxID=1448319 RepID=A0A8G1RMR9_9EURO|nr:uncharacterized protein BO72DRAFT_210441 [Aspergillus fijiensis CBS 313.89]RAK74261.1 hypothetical protein BO72DRAFT_210441 [Aspergillus fijiensis CBS 313.89]